MFFHQRRGAVEDALGVFQQLRVRLDFVEPPGQEAANAGVRERLEHRFEVRVAVVHVHQAAHPGADVFRNTQSRRGAQVPG